MDVQSPASVAQRPSVFLTGGTGFLGAYLLRKLLAKGFHVKALRRGHKLPTFFPEEIFQPVEWIDGNILDPILLEDCINQQDIVVHAAAMVSFSAKDRQAMYATNIDGTANLVNAALEKNARYFVHVSSVAALGRSEHGDVVDEGSPWDEKKLNTHYAITKYHAEMELWRGVGEGLKAVVVNPSTILGYGDWNTGSCAIFKSVYDQFPWYTDGINGFVDVEDVSSVIIQLIEKEIAAERFIINAENVSFKTVFDLIADGFHRHHPSRRATPLLGAAAWRMEKIKSVLSGKTPLLTKETAKIAQSKTHFNNKKILSSLPDFRFKPISQTIAEACSAYLVNISKQPGAIH